MPESKPVVSIITVTFNAGNVIEKTIDSIIGQTYKNIEYIVIDGGSTDNTLEILKKYETHISKLISEPDKGIYDAMNKGIKYASGDYLWFMNAGDEIYEAQTLERSIEMSANADVYYGEAEMISENGEKLGLRSEVTTQKLPGELTWKKMDKGMIVCHQSIIVKRTIAPEFNLRYYTDADIDWVINVLKKSEKIIYTGSVLSKFLAIPVLGKFYGGGTSSFKRFSKSLIERFIILRKHFGLGKTVINHISIIIRAIFFRQKTNNPN